MARNKTTIGTAKRKNTKKHEDESVENSSDFEDMAAVGLTAAERNKFEEFGKVLIKSAVSELRCEFEKFAVDAVEIALSGNNMAELREQVEKIEAELSKLRKVCEKLKEEAQKKKGGNAELQRQMEEKEKEIKMKERQLSQLNRRISKCQKEFKDEQVKHEEIERALRQELVEVKSKYNKAKGMLLAKDAADHIARDQLPELRQKIAELERQKEKAKRKY